MKVVVITQARTGSTRLPNKVLKEIQGKSLLQIHVNRIKQANLVDEIYIATTTNENDNQIEALAKHLKVKCYRGSEVDVLDRFYQAVKNIKPDLVVRLTSDCPLIDALLIDSVIEKAIFKKTDYCSNTFTESYPDGQDIEVFTFKALEKAWKLAKLESEREHVTPYIKKNSSFYNKSEYKSFSYESSLLKYSDVRMTVDEPNDFIMIKELIKELGQEAKWEEYAELYINTKSIYELNRNVVRNEGYLKSINKEK